MNKKIISFIINAFKKSHQESTNDKIRYLQNEIKKLNDVIDDPKTTSKDLAVAKIVIEKSYQDLVKLMGLDR